MNRGRRAIAWGLAASVAGLGLGGWWSRRDGPARLAPPGRPGLAVREVLGGDPADFARAEAPRTFHFPADHGPHPEYRSEWWYFTGNLRGPGGRPFGFQFTLFRFALARQPPERPSAWAAGQVYMGHLALADAGGRRFHASERLSRAALGLAGARADPLRVWLEDWVAEGQADGGFRISAFDGDTGVALDLYPAKPVVLQGEAGLSQKSAEVGNASYYYSFTRMRARGTVRAGGPALAVDGLAWMDREWGTSALGPDQVGWDWFALQLDDGYDLMYYQLRRSDGTADPCSKGTLVDPAGAARTLRVGEVEVEVRGDWRSPRDGARYPASWRLRAAAAGLDLEVHPLLPDQELHLSVRYWEGAVQIRGTHAGRPVEGRGYVELTGYAGASGRPSGQGGAGG